MIRRVSLAVTAALLLLTPRAIKAHDYWLEASDYTPDARAKITLELRVGDDFVAAERRGFQPERTRRFELVTADGIVDLMRARAAGDPPVLDGYPTGATGQAMWAMERRWVDIKLPDDRFTHYLEHEGLTEIIELRARRGHRAQERECYMRSIKALTTTASNRAPVHDVVLGHPIEIVLLDDPYAAARGDKLRVQVLLEGAPLPRAPVTAHVRLPGGGVRTARARTNRRGVARIELTDPGVWLVRLVHLRPCDECTHTDWESFWASYSFAVD